MLDAEIQKDSLVALIAESIIDAQSPAELTKRMHSLVSGASKMSGAWVEGARDAIKEGNHVKGVKRGVLAIISAPKSARARSFARSDGFRKAFSSGKARALLDEIIANPGDAVLYQNLSTYFRREKQPDIAALGYCRALVLDSDDEESARSLAAVLRDQNFLDAGLTLTRLILTAKPDAAWLWVQQGNILSRLERHAESVAAFEKAIGLDNQIPGLQAALAREYKASGESTSAIETYRAAIEHDHKDYQSMEALGDVYSSDGQFAHAILWYRRALAMRDNQRIRDKIYQSLLDLGLWEAAAQELHPDIKAGLTEPGWGGDIDENQTLIINAGNESTDANVVASTIIGLQLAAAGQPVAIVCPPEVANIVAPVSNKKIRFFSDLNKATKRLPRAEAVSLGDFRIENEAVKRVAGFDAGPIAGLRKRKKNTPPKIGFISDPDAPEGMIDPKDVSAHLPKGTRITSHRQNARQSVERTIPLLDMLDGVVTNDQMTAILAAATGCPSVFLHTSGKTTPFSNLCSSGVFGPGQTVLRTGKGGRDPGITNRVAFIIASDFKFIESSKAPKVSDIPDDVFETILCLDEELPNMGFLTLPVAQLKGGTRNAAYQLGSMKNAYVLRMGRFPVPQQGFYAKESRNMRIAADAGLAPKVWHTDTLDGSMVIDFIDGEVMRTKTLSQMDNAVDAAKLLREVHSLPGFRGSFDILTKIDRNMKTLREKHPDLLSGYEASAEMMAHITQVLRSHRVPHYATHNDPLTRNFIRASNGKMMLIDWECSAVSDPHWEVAALSSQGSFAPDVWQAYMTAYFGDSRHPAACRVALYEAVCRYYWWTDGLVDSQKSDDTRKATKKAYAWRDMYADIVNSEGFKRALAKAEDYEWSPDHSPMAI